MQRDLDSGSETQKEISQELVAQGISQATVRHSQADSGTQNMVEALRLETQY